jgi:acyl-CoA hydrolase
MQSVSEQELASHLAAVGGDEPRFVIGGNFATPSALVQILDATLAQFHTFTLNARGGLPVRDGVVNETPFIGTGLRHDDGVEYIPTRLSLVPRLYATVRPPDCVLVQTSPPRGGKVSLGIEVNILSAAIEHVRRNGGKVVAQVNRFMPYTFGDAEIDCDDVDFALEADEELASPAQRPLDDVTAQIGENVSRFITDGSTIQLGIGQVPDATAPHLYQLRNLGVWSEMISDGVLNLERCGALDPDRVIQSSFLFGSPELYEWADGNPRLRMSRTETINDPGLIARNESMVSLNSALQLDLFVQANASSLGHKMYSGFGGQPDFVVGALHSRGGHALIALRSWHDRSATSSIVPILDQPITSIQHSAVVTEHGAAEIFGASEGDQARLIIERVADPRAHEDLWRGAEALGLLGRTASRALEH